MRGGNSFKWLSEQVWSSGRGVDVFDLGIATQFILIARQTAEEDAAAEADDGGAPAKPVGPGVEILALEDQLVEHDGVDDQSNDLENHNNNQQCSCENQEADVDMTHCHNRDDEGNDEDDETNDHQSCHCHGPRVLRKRLAVPLVVPASALFPHTGVVRPGALVLDPSGLCADSD